MSILPVVLLAIFAFVVGVATFFVVGTIVVTNIIGNYEIAGRHVFPVGLTAVIIALGIGALYGALAATSLWILVVSGIAILGWMLMIASAR